MSVAYLLVFHGSRDPRPQKAVSRLVHRLAAWISPQPAQADGEAVASAAANSQSTDGVGTQVATTTPEPLVASAPLECGEQPLHVEIYRLGQQLLQTSDREHTIRILPLFLLEGVHVREDIPQEVEQARQMLPATVRLQLLTYIGSYSPLTVPLAEAISERTADAWMLISHGTRRWGGNQPVEQTAAKLAATSQQPVFCTYWSVSPYLSERIDTAIAAGYRRIGVLPYFLFPGGLTDAIGEQIQQLQASRNVECFLTPPMGMRDKFIRLLYNVLKFDRIEDC